MNEMFNLKAIITALIGTGIAGTLITLPVRANENNLTKVENNGEIILSQSDYGNISNNNETSDSIKDIIGLTGLAIGTGVVGYQVSKAYKPSFANLSPSSKCNTGVLNKVNPKLRRELLRLVHNQATASRLLDGTYSNHPGRSANWVAEKVIYDLKRNR